MAQRPNDLVHNLPMPESPTLLFRDAQTDRVYRWTMGDGDEAHRVLVDDEGHRLELPAAATRSDFARYQPFGIELPVGVGLVRREDDGGETPFALERYDESEPAEGEPHAPWRATFASPDGTRLVLTEAALLEGLLERPPVYRFAE